MLEKDEFLASDLHTSYRWISGGIQREEKWVSDQIRPAVKNVTIMVVIMDTESMPLAHRTERIV